MKLLENKYAFPVVLIIAISICAIAVVWIASGDETANIITINDENYYPAVKDLFINAEDSIDIVIYGAKYYPNAEDSQANSLIEELGNAAERGVDVRVVFDESWPQIVDTAIKLKSLGVDVKFDRKDRTTHSKFIVIDGEIVVVGSTNWSDAALEDNHEANVIIHNSELASEYEGYFKDIWKGK